ncbi:MAG: helix-turn-helix domain-containing protein [Oscillospiraceae bacterium]
MDKSNKITIGERIKDLRLLAGLTQKELSKKIHIGSRQTIALWESDERDLKTQHTVALSKFFKVSCDYILTGVHTENVDANRTLGLSNKAIEALKMYVDERKNGNYDDAIKGINAVFETEAPYKFFQNIHCYMAQVIKDPLDMYEKEAKVDTKTGAIRFGEYTFQPEMLDKCFLLDMQEYLMKEREKEEEQHGQHKTPVR